MFGNNKNLNLIKELIKFQGEMIKRIKAVREAGNVDYPYIYNDGLDEYYIGSVSTSA